MKIYYVILFFLFSMLSRQAWSQAGITVSPGRIYFKSASGSASSQKILVTNPNSRELEVGVSVSDWDYDTLGNNRFYDAGTLKTSCADWVRVLPGSFFTLQPGERRELNIMVNVPPGVDTSVNVHTAMIFLTQLNPGDAKAENGAAIKVSVRMGVKLYHSFSSVEIRDMEVLSFADVTNAKEKEPGAFLELGVGNTGKIWLEGKVKWELLNMQTGEKKKLTDTEFYSLPGDRRIFRKELPEGLTKGSYTATAVIHYGNRDELKVAELEFQY